MCLWSSPGVDDAILCFGAACERADLNLVGFDTGVGTDDDLGVGG